MKSMLVVTVCLFAVAFSWPVPQVPRYLAGWPYYHLGAPYEWWYPYYNDYSYNQYPRLIYYGEFTGSCDGTPDGLYYMDDYSFAYCSNGVKTIQPCAEGSANPGPSYFQHGSYYNFYDFCSVNLVAQGYTPGYKVPIPPIAAAPVQPVVHGYEVSYEETNYGIDNKVPVKPVTHKPVVPKPAPPKPAPPQATPSKAYDGQYYGSAPTKAAYDGQYYKKPTYDEKKNNPYEESSYAK